MAEIDIKDLGDAAAIANTDKIMAIINGLGKNLNWAKLKEQLARELPVATESSNGLMSANFYLNSMAKRRVLSENTNIDDIKEFGCYQTMNTSIFPWGILLVFNAGSYVLQLYFHTTSKTVSFRIFYINWYPVYSFTTNTESASSYSLFKNDLTDTMIEKAVSPNTPMTLEFNPEDEQVAQERYVYSIPKMAEAILLLQKELSDLKAK